MRCSSDGPAIGSRLLLQSTFTTRNTAKQTEHGKEFGSRFFPSLENGNAAALAHAGDVVEHVPDPTVPS